MSDSEGLTPHLSSTLTPISDSSLISYVTVHCFPSPKSSGGPETGSACLTSSHTIPQQWCTYLYVQFQRDRSDVRVEVEEPSGATSQPLRHILGVRQRRTERNDSDVALNLWRDVAHTWTNYFQYRLKIQSGTLRNLSKILKYTCLKSAYLPKKTQLYKGLQWRPNNLNTVSDNVLCLTKLPSNKDLLQYFMSIWSWMHWDRISMIKWYGKKRI